MSVFAYCYLSTNNVLKLESHIQTYKQVKFNLQMYLYLKHVLQLKNEQSTVVYLILPCHKYLVFSLTAPSKSSHGDSGSKQLAGKPYLEPTHHIETWVNPFDQVYKDTLSN